MLSAFDFLPLSSQFYREFDTLMTMLGREVTFASMGAFWDGFFVTLQVVVWGLILALVLGTVLGVFSTTRSRILRAISRVYVEFYQNTPLPVQVVFMYLMGPQLLQRVLGTPAPVPIPSVVLGFVGVGLYHAAYVSEVIRTGIESVPRGQMEAALSQGFTRVQAYIYIILPQTFKVILNSFVGTYGYLQGYFIACAMYFVICFPLAMLVQYLEKRSKRAPKPKKLNITLPETAKEA